MKLGVSRSHRAAGDQPPGHAGGANIERPAQGLDDGGIDTGNRANKRTCLYSMQSR